jgi:hypothetical protein
MRAISSLAAAFACAAALLAAGCSVSVNEGQDKGSKQADVDVKTPVGNVSVRAGGDTPADTGLRVYPGAQVKQKQDGPDSATVKVGGSFFGVKVAAANYESNASPDTIAAFYRTELETYGAVTECRGNIDFHGRTGAQPICRENKSSRELQLAVGSEENQHIVAIKPRGSASEFALVHVDARGGN